MRVWKLRDHLKYFAAMEPNDNTYYEDDYYGDEYYDEMFESTLHYCVLPVIAQVTSVFLKLFGLAAIVSC